MNRFHFANILFAGPCNLRCPYCIGQQLAPALSMNNLNDFPLRNLGRFVSLLKQNRVYEVTFTGTTTDPQLYRHEARLLNWLRRELSPDTRFSLHTNGQLALRKMDVINQYDRVSISFPSFEPDIYKKMTGSQHPPRLAEIVRLVRVPVKISCVINEHNYADVPDFLARCRDIGIKRLVVRQLYGDATYTTIVDHLPRVGNFCGNPVYNYRGMEVTHWNFDQSSARALNLFSNGLISPNYLLESADQRTSKLTIGQCAPMQYCGSVALNS
jgi:MoaA/NifB/PqqE/SkfB family radical SAM enzyme